MEEASEINHYTFCASLCITHPSIDPETISIKLGQIPTTSRRAGQQRVTPTGRRLNYKNKETYWSLRLHEEKVLTSKNIELEASLQEWIDRLQPQEAFFLELINSGGYIELFIGWFAEGNNFGASLPPTLLRQATKLNIAIGLDIYT